jgi:hypothetical protein
VSERSLVILSFEPTDSEENIFNSVHRRFFSVLLKNTLPSHILVLALGQVAEELLKSLKSRLVEAINALNTELQSLVDSETT